MSYYRAHVSRLVSTLERSVQLPVTTTSNRSGGGCGTAMSSAREGIEDLAWQCDAAADGCASAKKLAKAMTEFQTYIENNGAFILNYGERYRNGEAISSAMAESTVNQVVRRRIVKQQQMQWTPQGAYLLLQTRTRVLNDELEGLFRQWYPYFWPKVRAEVCAAA